MSSANANPTRWRRGLLGQFPRLPLLRRYLRACESLVAETLPELFLGEIQSWGGDLIVEV